MDFKLNYRNIFKTFRIGVFAIISCWGLIIRAVLIKYGVIEMPNAIPERMNTALFGLIIGTSIFWIPALICLIQYIHYSKGIELVLDSNTKLISVKSDKKTVNIKYSDIMMIKMVCSNAVAEKRIKFYADDPFYYYKIITTNGDKFIIPCLIIGEEMSDLYQDKIRVIPKFIAFISE